MKKIVVDTDLLIEHLLWDARKTPSDLRALMSSYFCYTTVFNAVEAFGLCRTVREREAVEASMSALKILGLNARSGKTIGGLRAAPGKRPDIVLLTAGLCVESRLPLVTKRKRLYSGIRGLRMMTPRVALSGIRKMTGSSVG